jgi:hypothetical protein
MDDLVLEAGAFYLMDRGYLDFTRLYPLVKQKPTVVAHMHIRLMVLVGFVV